MKTHKTRSLRRTSIAGLVAAALAATLLTGGVTHALWRDSVDFGGFELPFALAAGGDGGGGTISWGGHQPVPPANGLQIPGHPCEEILANPDRRAGAASLWLDLICAPIQGFGTSLSSGREHTIAISEYGHVWTWGMNTRAQLGTGGNAWNVTLPDRVFQPSAEQANLPGHEQTSSLLHCTGRQAQAHVENIGPNPYHAICNEYPPARAISVAAGNDFSLALDEFGRLWSWGRGENGILGVNVGNDWTRSRLLGWEHQSENRVPMLVPNMPRLVDISAGPGHALGLDAYGNVWAWGNILHLTDAGAPGLVGSDPQIVPICNPHTGQRERAVSIEASALRMDINVNQANFVITESGAIYAWGYNGVGFSGGAAAGGYLGVGRVGRPATAPTSPFAAPAGCAGGPFGGVQASASVAEMDDEDGASVDLYLADEVPETVSGHESVVVQDGDEYDNWSDANAESREEPGPEDIDDVLPPLAADSLADVQESELVAEESVHPESDLNEPGNDTTDTVVPTELDYVDDVDAVDEDPPTVPHPDFFFSPRLVGGAALTPGTLSLDNRPAIAIDSRNGRTFAIAVDGHIYSWGDGGEERTRLGLNPDYVHDGIRIDTVGGHRLVQRYIDWPTAMTRLPAGAAQFPAPFTTVDAANSAAIDANGNVWTWGPFAGHGGAGGYAGMYGHLPQWIHPQWFDGERVVAITGFADAEHSSSYAITYSGRLFVWGTLEHLSNQGHLPAVDQFPTFQPRPNEFATTNHVGARIPLLVDRLDTPPPCDTVIDDYGNTIISQFWQEAMQITLVHLGDPERRIPINLPREWFLSDAHAGPNGPRFFHPGMVPDPDNPGLRVPNPNASTVHVPGLNLNGLTQYGPWALDISRAGNGTGRSQHVFFLTGWQLTHYGTSGGGS